MFVLKKLAKSAVPQALENADRYRALKEPFEAQSICRDILEADPGNQKALIILLLALADGFGRNLTAAYQEAEFVLQQLGDSYCKAFYGGILAERRAKVHLQREEPGSGRLAYEWFTKAMRLYDQALQTCSPGNPEAALRWNSCARLIMQNPHLEPAEPQGPQPMLE
jgi:hypothetical protein